jgi:hypothetical protein
MSDDLNKTDDDVVADVASKPAAPSHEDLKAKLGLKLPEKKPVPVQAAAAPSVTGSGSSASGQPVKTTSSFAASKPEDADLVEPKGLSKSVLGVIAVACLFVFVFGIFVGGLFKSRAVENRKTREAAHLVEYFTTTNVEAVNGGPILEALTAHLEDTTRVFDMMNKADKPEQIEKASAELEAYIKRCQKYRDYKPYFLVDQAFPGVVYNGALASEVINFIESVRRLYDETVLFALEADTRDRVTAMEDKGADNKQILFYEPFAKENGEKWNKGLWISRVDFENPEKTATGTDYAMIPVGNGKAFKASTSSLVEVDVTPVAVAKSFVHKKAILDRVRARLGQIRVLVDEIKYENIDSKLKEVSGRGEYFTFF